MSVEQPDRTPEPLIVRTHVTPWGFLVALPLALVFAYLGARALDAHIVPEQLGRLDDAPFWLFSALLLGFALFLFLIGVGELAAYLKPAVEVVMDQDGVRTFGLLGERRLGWSELAHARFDHDRLELATRPRGGRAPRSLSLHLNRLSVEPARLLERIERHRPDLIHRLLPEGLDASPTPR